MSRLIYGGILAAGMLLATSQGFAATIYTAILTGPNEGNNSPATGFATATLNGDSLTVNVTWSGLTGGPATMAHIHCCVVPPGTAGVVLPFTGFPALTSGTYNNTFNLPTTLTGLTETAFITGLNAGQSYVNIHDAVYPAGEIRGFLVLAPEPSTFLLGAGVLGGLALLRRRKQSA